MTAKLETGIQFSRRDYAIFERSLVHPDLGPVKKRTHKALVQKLRKTRKFNIKYLLNP